MLSLGSAATRCADSRIGPDCSPRQERPYLRPRHLPSHGPRGFFDIEDDPIRGPVYLHGFVERPYAQGPGGLFKPVLCTGVSETQEELAFGAAWSYLQACAADSV